MLTSSDKKSLTVSAGCVGLVVLTGLAVFFYAPVDGNQGQVYRIIYLHVPAAFTAFATAAVLLVYSIIGLRNRSEDALRRSRAFCEVGLLFTALTLATGSIWGRPTWGAWWAWDARLTTTLLLAIMYAGWILLYTSMAPGPSRVRACSVLGILIAADVPVIYKSVTWWRTLHQPPSMMRPGGPTMDPAMFQTLVASIVALVILGVWLAIQRARNLALKDEIEAASFEQLSR